MRELVLIIEDDELFRSNLFDVLEAEDFNIISAGDGLSGLLLAQEYHPDLIICNINLPYLNGFGILNKLRKDLATAKTPFIFVTAETDFKNRCRAMQLGANAYLTKPLRLKKLLETITHQFQLTE